MAIYTPQLQAVALLHRNTCIIGEKTPTLADLAYVFGSKNVICWLALQITAVARAINERFQTPVNVEAINETAQLFWAKNYFYKVSEVLLFCALIRTGTFGDFFGRFDTQQFCSRTNDFDTIRRSVVYEHNLQKEQKEREARQRNSQCVTYEKYLEMKNAGLLDDIIKEIDEKYKN